MRNTRCETWTGSKTREQLPRYGSEALNFLEALNCWCVEALITRFEMDSICPAGHFNFATICCGLAVRASVRIRAPSLDSLATRCERASYVAS